MRKHVPVSKLKDTSAKSMQKLKIILVTVNYHRSHQWKKLKLDNGKAPALIVHRT